jgi:L-lysine 6-transaminase
MDRSEGCRLVDARDGRSYIDFFTFFASNPLGMNHPDLRSDANFMERLTSAALNKISNPDIYTTSLARFVDTFSRVGIPDYLPNAFFVSGGALAVENALKTAMDWKVRKNSAKGISGEVGTQVLHLEQAFHGRTGYTLSVTNTEPIKIANFAKFDWPRISNPMANVPLTPENLQQIEASERKALDQAKEHFRERKNEICCVLLEPIQGEGGDNHFRPEFLRDLADLVHENDALVIFDEVQTGIGLTGTFWAHQQLGVRPDILAFGKKAQVCGILAGGRLDEVEDNVFQLSSRINSTWGGNLVDIVRFDRILEIIEEKNLVDNAAQVGSYLLDRLKEFADQNSLVTNPRGRGLMCAFDLPDGETRDKLRDECYERGLIILGCGHRTLRFRPALTVTTEVIDEGLAIVQESLQAIG